jgi:hypothetical protein
VFAAKDAPLEDKQPQSPPCTCGIKLDTKPHLYVQVRYEPQPGEPDYVRIRCENTRLGKAIAAYLSPFDAMVDAAYFSAPGQLYHVIPIHHFDPSEFIRDQENKLTIGLHVAWGAYDRKLIPRNKGQLSSFLETESFAVNDINYVELDVPCKTLQLMDRVHEYAGLHAYREAYQPLLDWNEMQRHQAVAKAIQSIPGTCQWDSDVNQLALYDPEAEQWHFVPTSLLDGEA